MAEVQKRTGVEEPEFTIDVAIGDLVRITDGPFKNRDGKVSEVDSARGKVKVLVAMFGTETPVELDFLQMTKV
jgi:transcriptional antiterminator NusG